MRFSDYYTNRRLPVRDIALERVIEAIANTMLLRVPFGVHFYDLRHEEALTRLQIIEGRLDVTTTTLAKAEARVVASS